ncbi:hypothetical protein BC829DRAFT_443801 [Chytridium lagenaria]|nr:hypothetical protein BC829DRAFT_443801 [Chytridium lagenaria]
MSDKPRVEEVTEEETEEAVVVVGENGGGHRGGNREADKEDVEEEAILDLAKYMNHKIRVKFAGGREVVGTLKGYDPLMNLVIDDTEEYLENQGRMLEEEILDWLFAENHIDPDFTI